MERPYPIKTPAVSGCRFACSEATTQLRAAPNIDEDRGQQRPIPDPAVTRLRQCEMR